MKANVDVRTRSVQMSLLLVITVGFSTAFIIAGRPFLPPKYSYDEEKIAALSRNEPGIPTDRSFQIVADIYRFFGLNDMPLLAGIIGFAFFCLVLLVALRGQILGPLSFVRVGIVAAVVFLGAVYLGHYAKELFILPICALVALRFRRWHWDLIVLVFMVIYAIYFRSYWFIVCGFYIAFRLLLLRYSPLKSFVIGATLGLAALSVAFSTVMGLDLDHYRLIVNDTRVDNVDAQSAIQPLTSMGGMVGGYINALAVLLSFAFPVALLLKGQLFYLLIVAFCVSLWFLVLRSLQRVWRTGSGQQTPAWIARCAALLFAFTVVQSIFEPDYGSYIRHLSPLLPLMLAMVLLPVVQLPATSSDSGQESFVENGR